MTEVIKERKYVRTTITNPNGTITTARINLITGVIKPYNYFKGSDDIVVSAKEAAPAVDYGAAGDLLDYIPHWVTIPAPNYQDRIKAGFKPRISKDNPNNVFLSEYISLEDAVFDINVLEHLFEGVSQLDDGKSRPMNKSLMFSMLRDLDTINSETIQGYTGHSERHCQKLALYLRVLSNAFDREVER